MKKAWPLLFPSLFLYHTVRGIIRIICARNTTHTFLPERIDREVNEEFCSVAVPPIERVCAAICLCARVMACSIVAVAPNISIIGTDTPNMRMNINKGPATVGSCGVDGNPYLHVSKFQ